MTPAKLWINGQWCAAQSGAQGESLNPANGKLLGRFAAADAHDAHEAIAAARRAFELGDWSGQPRRRAAVLLAFAQALEDHKDELSAQLCAENGKLLSEAQHELQAAVSEARYYAGLARNVFGRVGHVEPKVVSMLAREPLGVAGIIVPWNAPVTLMVRSLAPALAAGCTAVVKAAPQTALINAAVFELLAQTPALPAGVVNMLCETGNAVAQTLVASPEVDVISYTGSTEVGKRIMAGAADTLKRLNLELGGSAPCLVFEDADLDHTVPALVRAGTVMAGQMCTAASRVLVHQSRLDEVQSRLQEALSQLVVGPGDDPASQMGPMIDVENRDRIARLVDATQEHVLLRGKPLGGPLACGAFIGPSLVAVEDLDDPLVCEEVFGPVLTVCRFADEDQAVALANRTRYGLAASVWTQNLQRAQRVAARLQSGTVWVNAHNRLMAEAETGGYRQSGLGRLHGVEGLEAFLQTKHICWDL